MCKIVNASDLRNRSVEELNVLFRIVSQKLAECEPETQAQRNMLVSLKNIRQTIALRQSQNLKPPCC